MTYLNTDAKINTHAVDTSTHGVSEVADKATVSSEIDSDISTHASLNIHLPSGLISMWHGLISAVPSGWVLCDGTNSTPDLCAKFTRGAPAATEAGTTGGSDTHTLTVAEMPAHTHSGQTANPAGAASGSSPVSGESIPGQTGTAGGGDAHNNMPAYYEILYIMKI